MDGAEALSQLAQEQGQPAHEAAPHASSAATS